MNQNGLQDIDPFDTLDAEATRLEGHFSTLDESDWRRPSRCAGWSVRDVLAHLAGEEMYNHACLNDDLPGFFRLLNEEGVSETGFGRFNEWCVQVRADSPIGEILEEWRRASSQTRSRMRQLGHQGMLQTSAGSYPAGLQALHYASEYATHADDVGVPVAPEEEVPRTRWRALFGRFALEEQQRPVIVEMTDDLVRVSAAGHTAEISWQDFIAATVCRLPEERPLADHLRAALCCLA